MPATPALSAAPIVEGTLSATELLLKCASVAHLCNATAAIVVLFTNGEYKSYQFNCEDVDFLRARRVIQRHKAMHLAEH